MRACILPLASAALALAACQQQQATSPDASRTAAPSTSATPAATTPTVAPNAAAAIPARFRGVWDNEAGSCDPTSDLRLEIGANQIEFYESLGMVGAVTIESPDEVVVDLAMEGEGEKWTVQNRYALKNGGKTLTPSDAKDDNVAPIPRKRCPS